MNQLDRMTLQPEMMGGKPCIRELRVTVGMVVGQMGSGHSLDEVLADLSLSGNGGCHASAMLCGVAS